MKHTLFWCAAMLLSRPVAHAQMTMAPRPQAKPLNVAFLVFPGVEALDLSGPLDVFVKANDIAPAAFNIYTVSTGAKTVVSQSGVLTLSARYSLSQSPRPDIVIVPGASVEQARKIGNDARVQGWLRANSSPNQTVMTVCTGAFIAGAAGLLDGKNSTTHWFCLQDFQRQFPRTKAFSDARFVRDGNILSTAGVSSGIDGALELVEQTRGEQTANVVARALQYRRDTPAFPDAKLARVKLLPKRAVSKTAQKLALDFDPVCHMKVGAQTRHFATFNGRNYGFCSDGCRHVFEEHPGQFLKTK